MLQTKIVIARFLRNYSLETAPKMAVSCWKFLDSETGPKYIIKFLRFFNFGSIPNNNDNNNVNNVSGT